MLKTDRAEKKLSRQPVRSWMISERRSGCQSKELITAVSLMALFIILKVYVGKIGTKLIDAFTTIHALMGRLLMKFTGTDN